MGERNHLEISQNHLYYELQIQGNMPHLTMKCLVSQLTNKANRELKISLSRPMTAGICSSAPPDPEKDERNGWKVTEMMTWQFMIIAALRKIFLVLYSEMYTT